MQCVVMYLYRRLCLNGKLLLLPECRSITSMLSLYEGTMNSP